MVQTKEGDGILLSAEAEKMDGLPRELANQFYESEKLRVAIRAAPLLS